MTVLAPVAELRPLLRALPAPAVGSQEGSHPLLLPLCVAEGSSVDAEPETFFVSRRHLVLLALKRGESIAVGLVGKRLMELAEVPFVEVVLLVHIGALHVLVIVVVPIGTAVIVYDIVPSVVDVVEHIVSSADFGCWAGK